jgi:hypothetical protein
MTGDTLPPVAAPQRVPKEPSRIGRTLRWVVLLVLGLGVMLLLYAIASRLNPNPDSAPPFTNHTTHHTPTGGSQTTSSGTGGPPAATLKPIEVVGATSFDPPPGSGEENSATAPLAIDGDPSTSWQTEVYFDSADFNGDKPGVGLVLDLGAAHQVSRVKVTLVGSPTSLELRAAPPDAAVAPTGSLDDYPVAATITDAGEQATFTLDKPVTTRFLLVWLTRIPEVPTGFQGKVAEIQVLG